MNVEEGSRVRRAMPQFIETKCVLIDSVAKERCDEKVIERDGRYVTERKSCGIDENFQVEYYTRQGQHVTSMIQTFGRKFSRKMKPGDHGRCYYNSMHVEAVRWIFYNENVDTTDDSMQRIISIALAALLIIPGLLICLITCKKF